VADGHVNAQDCLSYLTIEQAGEIAPRYHVPMGGTLFGCDCCTAVCPWNRFGEEKVLPEFRARGEPSAAECLTMDEAGFHARFAGTAVLRSGLKRLQRNARVAVQAVTQGP
jgi:epoxyqueuosine reductase